MEKFYTVSELAKLLNCSKRTVLRLIAKWKIKAVNLGGGNRPSWRIYDGELQRLMAESYENQEG